MTIDAPTLDTITGHTVMVKMRELIKQMTTFAKEVADLVNTIPTDIQDTYSREAIDEMLNEIDSAISTLSDSVYPKTEVYNKTESDELIGTKADADSVYTKSETDELLSVKANTSDVYDKTETDELLSAKPNSSDVYNKTETDNLLSAKANSNNVYTKSETDNLLSAKQDELTAGTGITIQNNVISATGGTGGETWVVVGENDWATYVDDNRYMSAKEDLKVRFQLNNGIKGEYYVYKNYSIFDVNARILANVFYANSTLKISYFVNGYDANNNRNSVTSNKFYYDIVTIASDGTTDTVNMQASKVQQGVMSSHYFEILHKL